jgi:GNAT superfamily N-acetyltransferase
MISIEKAELEDASKITEIKIQAFNKEINTYLGRDGGPPGYNKIESEIDIINNHIAYKVLLENQIIGAFFLIQMSETKMRFEDFVILPSRQGNGYGYATLQLVEKAFSSIEEWFLSTPVFSVGNQHLYEKFGYSEIGRNNDEIEYCKRIIKL